MLKSIDYVDVVIGTQYGDEGKGKITNHLSKDYDIVARWAGGNNAGHTVYVNGEKYATHLIPSGIFFGKKSLIGPGCVLHPESFFKELEYLKSNGFDTDLVKVHPNCHIVLDEYIEFDKENLADKLGTTSKGIAPTYAAKAARTGVLAKDVLPKKYIWDSRLKGKILCEGAQGVWLDINHGNYPYVTSSETLAYAACSIGFPPQLIRKIYGGAKIYETRSGNDPLFPDSLFDDKDLLKISELGSEFGVTTGRRRKVDWLNLNRLLKSLSITGVTNLVISKCDILEELGVFKLYYNGLEEFKTLDDMKKFITDVIVSYDNLVEEIIFSSSPEKI